MDAPRITTTIITLNEEKSLPKALESVSWTDEIVVVDSGSTDQTTEIAKKFGAKVFFNRWPGYGAQKNFAQSKASNDWVLNIDADEVVPKNLAKEIRRQLAQNGREYLGYEIPRKTFYLGRWIRHGGWYPNYLIRLAHRKHSKWTEPQVHESWIVDGKTGRMRESLDHYTFDGIEDQVSTNLRYAGYGFLDLQRRGSSPHLLKLLFKPAWKFFDSYLLKRGFLDGLPGFIIATNAAHSMFLKYAYLVEAQMSPSSENQRPRSETQVLNNENAHH